MRLDELIKYLQEHKEMGNLEVFVVNEEKECFDSISTGFVARSASSGDQYLILTRGKDSIRFQAP